MPLDLKLTKYTTAAPAIASYTFSELISGLGFIKFYLLTASSTSGTDYIMSEDTRFSSVIETTTSATEKTLTFLSSEFNIPRTVSGVAHINVGWKTVGASGAYISATLSKFDGTTTTPISSTIQSSNLAVTNTGIISLELPCTETFISQGEQLKIVVLFNAPSSSTLYSGHDPMNRDGTHLIPSSDNSITSSNINVPFKIDL